MRFRKKNTLHFLYFSLKKRGYNLILVSTEELQEELKLLSTHIERTFLIRTVTVIYRWNSPQQPLELTSPITSISATWSTTTTPPTVGQTSLTKKFHRAGSFDRLETIETIARNGNLVLYVNCTRPFNDQNLSKTINPAEFQSIVNNYLIPPMQLAYIVCSFTFDLDIFHSFRLGSSFHVSSSSTCVRIECGTPPILSQFHPTPSVNHLCRRAKR